MTELQHADLVGDQLHVPWYFQDTDPGAVGAWKAWIKTDESPLQVRVRNSDDDGWLILGPLGIDLATLRTAYGLGTMATQDADAVAITGGTIDGTAIGTTTPSSGKFSSLDIESFGSGTTPLRVIATDDGPLFGPVMAVVRQSSSPAENDIIGALQIKGSNSAGEEWPYVSFYGQILDPTDGSEDGQFNLGASINGVITSIMAVGNGVRIGTPNGGFKGLGTLNAVAVYDDNVLLTCYPLEAERTGAVDVERWNEAAGREHEPARKFAERIEDLDPVTFAAKWRATGVLPGMPTPEEWAENGPLSTGQMIQRLWEIVELQAVHIARLSDQVFGQAEAKP